MKSWPDTDGSIINRYLSQLRLRCLLSPIYYRQTLRSFQDVVVRHQSQVNRKVLEAWLHERSRHWPGPTLLHRARILDRFLDYLAQKEWIPSNPIADLRSEYRVKSSRAICAALLEPKPDEALESRRQP